MCIRDSSFRAHILGRVLISPPRSRTANAFSARIDRSKTQSWKLRVEVPCCCPGRDRRGREDRGTTEGVDPNDGPDASGCPRQGPAAGPRAAARRRARHVPVDDRVGHFRGDFGSHFFTSGSRGLARVCKRCPDSRERCLTRDLLESGTSRAHHSSSSRRADARFDIFDRSSDSQVET